MHYSSFILLAVCLTGVFAADPPPSLLPLDAQRALAAFNAVEAKIKADADARVAVERKKLLAALEVAKVAATKAGKLEEALAVKGLIDEQGKIVVDAKIDKEIGKERLGALSFAEFGGAWDVTIGGWRTVITFNKDGTVTDSADGVNGKWLVEGDVVRANLNRNLWKAIHPRSGVVDDWKNGKETGKAVRQAEPISPLR